METPCGWQKLSENGQSGQKSYSSSNIQSRGGWDTTEDFLFCQKAEATVVTDSPKLER